MPQRKARQKPFPARTVQHRRHKLGAAEARWENEGGAEEGEEPSDRRHGAFSIKAAPPFRLDLSVWALRRRRVNALDRWDGKSYRRVLTFIDGEVEFSVSQAGGAEAPCLDIALVGDRVGRDVEAKVVAGLERMLGLKVDLSNFYKMAAVDNVIGPVVARYRGVKPPRFPTVFESLLNAVANQQLSLESGLSLLNRLGAIHGRTTSTGRTSLHAFPRPQDLAGLEPQALHNLGFSRRKSATIIELARSVVAGRLDLESLERLPDDDVVAQLTSLSGIGRWSAEYVLLRGLGRLHVFPGDDVGARNNLARWLGLEPPLDYSAVERAVARWQPYAGMIYFHLLLARLDAAGQLAIDQTVVG